MGLLRSTFHFLTGTVAGIYIAQNYNVPDIAKLSSTLFLITKHIEENYRKPKNPEIDEV